MHLPHVRLCGVYKMEEQYRQKCTFSGINLTISGRIYCRGYFADGKEKFVAGNKPSIHLIHQGDISDFSFGPNRENWVLMFESSPWKYDPTLPGLLWEMPDNPAVPLRHYAEVDEVTIPSLRNSFARIAALVQSSLNTDRLRADLLAANLLTFFLPEDHSLGRPRQQALQFRKKIDADERWEYSLEELCRQCNCNHDYLRREFQQQYGISPAKYRQQRRLAKIIHLFTYTNMTMKEVAYEIGMKNSTHLNLLLKKEYHCTPSELCRSCRGKKLDGLSPDQ